MPGGIGRAFSVAIAAQFQALGILALAWLGGEWLNERYPKNFNWYLVTFLIAIVTIAQTFYVILRHFMQAEQREADRASKSAKGPVKKEGGHP